jgi:hypothetical protein
MLTTIKFRANVKSNDKAKTDMTTKLTLALELETRVHKQWYNAREQAERQRDSEHLHPARGVADEEDNREDLEDPRGRRNLRLSNLMV